jgi:outer membrane lipoprotein SlyB
MVSALVGLSESEAAAMAKDKGWELRVVSRDGEDFMVTQDYKTDRVNITVKSGKVTKASVG